MRAGGRATTGCGSTRRAECPPSPAIAPAADATASTRRDTHRSSTSRSMPLTIASRFSLAHMYDGWSPSTESGGVGTDSEDLQARFVIVATGPTASPVEAALGRGRARLSSAATGKRGGSAGIAANCRASAPSWALVPKTEAICRDGSILFRRPAPNPTRHVQGIREKRLMGFEPTTFCMATTLADCGFRHRNRFLQGFLYFPGKCSVRDTTGYAPICSVSGTPGEKFPKPWSAVPVVIFSRTSPAYRSTTGTPIPPAHGFCGEGGNGSSSALSSHSSMVMSMSS